MRKWLYRFFFVVVLLLLTIVGSCVIFSKPRPKGVAGPEADALARKVEAAVNKKAWDKIGAIRWDFGGREQLLWDKKRMFARVVFNKGSVVAHIPLQRPESGYVSMKGKEVTGPKAKKKLLRIAYARWANDSFWLNPLAKMFDDGVSRKLVTWKGKKQLLVEYKAGGLTPGDAYLYVLGPNHLPTQWHMWVKIIPLKGATASHEGWLTLYNGAKVSTRHNIMSLFTLKLTKINAADTVEKLVGSDPFARLVSKVEQRGNPVVPATSRPSLRTPHVKKNKAADAPSLPRK